ncbi:alpha/beta hydrolase [uncultured Acetobacteroides sp.]|uniref:alpha/beta hydrolase n=1 Tax=uncultured Acetobacteroides sp. TaxID=1760811 RepID=UPI0029F5A639|nr:alpha/beta hydrolase [uncultured Acetobacteroides sp.]
MRKRDMATLFFMVALSLNVMAQPKAIDIWQGKVPGAIADPSYKFAVDTTSAYSFICRVSNPILDMYPAPTDKANGTAVVICPGGGYAGLAFKHEGAQVASWLNSLGVTAFVLKYRLPSDAIMKDKSVGPLQDAEEAIRIVRRHAKEWNISPAKIGIMGFSAGGHLAATLSTHFDEQVYKPADETSARPDFSILIYPVISMDSQLTHSGSRRNLLGDTPSEELVKHYSNELQVTANTPPAFLVHSSDDKVVPVKNSIDYALALGKYNISYELHIFKSGGHGYGLGKSDGTEKAWPEICKSWLKARGLL